MTKPFAILVLPTLATRGADGAPSQPSTGTEATFSGDARLGVVMNPFRSGHGRAIAMTRTLALLCLLSACMGVPHFDLGMTTDGETVDPTISGDVGGVIVGITGHGVGVEVPF